MVLSNIPLNGSLMRRVTLSIVFTAVSSLPTSAYNKAST